VSPGILIKIMSDNDDSDVGRAPRRGGRKTGVPNYQNAILIRIVERILPNGNEGWRQVALLYKEESGEVNLRSEDDLKKNWVRKLCNNMKKPTGRMGADAKDRINKCIGIERKILDRTSSGILGGSSEDELNPSSSPSSEDEDEDEDGEYKQPESSEDEEEEEVPGTEVQPNDAATSFSQPPPVPALPPMDVADYTDGNANAIDTNADDVDTNAVAIANAAALDENTVNEANDEFNIEVAQATQTARRATTSASVDSARQGTTPVDFESRRKSKSRRTGKTSKTKNSTNRERSSVTKSIEKIASSIADGKSDDLQQFMLMRKMEWDEAEERSRQEREEARREREEARREREEMEDRRDRRLERQMQQQTQNMQMMMMMIMGTGAMGAGARQFPSVPTMNAENVEEENNDNEVKDD
jgi:hypothetical protein